MNDGKYRKPNSMKQILSVLRFIRIFCEKDENLKKVFSSRDNMVYFAVILKHEFNRGKVCWIPESNIFVWKDTDGTRYTINGIDNTECEFPMDIRYIVEFNGGTKKC